MDPLNTRTSAANGSCQPTLNLERDAVVKKIFGPHQDELKGFPLLLRRTRQHLKQIKAGKGQAGDTGSDSGQAKLSQCNVSMVG